ncbi:MAG: hypothetical protein A3A73_03170 [Omnitrophica bacterium RIFCSPLOWO2_01_FULL_50_24]|nr:MAG: hypothetical protein A3A73_03170 [Omnitrophica bacterium RIFCSPLOWO2_01_FULL_50_24]
MRKIHIAGWLAIAMMVTNFLLYPADLGQAQTLGRTDVAVSSPVNVNKASMEELQTVRGIGPALAQRIVEYREANGKFESLDNLVSIRGISSAKLEKIKNQVTL